jgi:hypothetical protein
MSTYKDAVELLKAVLLQGDEKDELQIKIEEFLIANGELKTEKPKDYSRMTKKQFKEECRSETYTGWKGRRIRKNAFYFDYKSSGTHGQGSFAGYKFMVVADYENCSKAELFNLFYDWITGKISGDLPPYVRYRIAENDQKRFKISLSM